MQITVKLYSALRIIGILLYTAVMLCACIKSDVPPDMIYEQIKPGRFSAADKYIEPMPAPKIEFKPESEKKPAVETESKKPVLDCISEMLSAMTIEEKIGQLFLIGCKSENAARDAAEYHIGGFILFASDFCDRTPEQAKNAVKSYQAAAKIPLFIAVDEEGGSVVRVSKYTQYRSKPFKSPSALYNDGGLEALLDDIDEKSILLGSIGINCNLAPVCDIAFTPDNYIYPRTLGLDACTTADVIGEMTKRYNENKMGCVLKHFPGYAGNSDTHMGLSRDTRDLSVYENRDLLPFYSGIGAGAKAVMVSHNIVDCIDSQNPASLSAKVYSLLREKMGFEGVIITDALDMGSIKEFSSDKGGSVSVIAFLAGCDLICISEFEQEYIKFIAAVEDGTITLSRIDKSVERILLWKSFLGLI